MKLSNTAVACVPYYFVDGAYWVPAVESGISALLVIGSVFYSRYKRQKFEKRIEQHVGGSRLEQIDPFDNNESQFLDESILLPKYDIVLWVYAAVFALQLS